MNTEPTLYERLGGYDAIAALSDNLLGRLRTDAQLGRFWQHRGDDGIQREKQLLIDFLCSNAGGPMYYTGRDMRIAHHGMKITESDWDLFIGHLKESLAEFGVTSDQAADVLGFVGTTKREIVEN